MKKIIRYFFLVLISLTSAVIGMYGQDTLYIQQPDTVQIQTMSLVTNSTSEIPQIMTPSPKASSIMKFGEHPVSLYTGLVDITIPIYTIERSGIKVPIEFKYHASGLKYNDTSNEIGLGWTLVAGGVITYSVRGGEGGGFSSTDINNITICDGITTNGGLSFLREIENGSRNHLSYDNTIGKGDGEIDIYSFSFLNHSGSFCFPSMPDKAAPPTGLFIPNNGMKVTNQTNLQIELYDIDGVYYKFEVKDNDYYFLHKEKQKEYYLTKIISTNKADTINFSYENMSACLNYIPHHFINSSFTESTQTPFDGHSNGPIVHREESGGRFYYQSRPPRLKRINFSGGYIDLEYDVKNNTQTWDLQNIKIYNNNQSSPLQIITLAKSKYSNGEDRLDMVTFSNNQSHSYNYQFGYNGEPGSINAGNGIDYWGYFNGATVPYGKCYTPLLDNMPYGMSGTNRNANESVMQGGILNKIIYPTKGYTIFKYEGHKASTGSAIPLKSFGGLRVKEIRNYLSDGVLAERKWYEYRNAYAQRYPDISDFVTNTRILTVADTQWAAPHVCWKTDIKHYSTFPKINYFMSGGSPVVYGQVTEYTGNDMEAMGSTVYSYDINRDEELPEYGDTYRRKMVDTYYRTYPWKTNNLKKKEVYKKEGDTYSIIYSLQNKYKEINTDEYLNLRVLPNLSFRYSVTHGNSTPEMWRIYCREIEPGWNNGITSPFDYFNYYLTTGLQVLEESIEITDGVTIQTNYEDYNKNGLPTTIIRTTSTGENVKTVNKYPTDFSTDTYKRMTSANILTPVVEQETYRGSKFLGKEINNYQLFHSLFYAPITKQVQYADGTIKTRMLFNYNKRAKTTGITKDDSENVVYLWGYGYQYPIAEIKNATYSEVTAKISEATQKTIAEKKEPSNSDWTLVESLRTSLPNTLITTCKYKPLIGLTSLKNPREIVNEYTYDDVGRLTDVHFIEYGVRKLLQKYDYNYSKNGYSHSDFSVKIEPGSTNNIAFGNYVAFAAKVSPEIENKTITWTWKDGQGNILGITNASQIYFCVLTEELIITCEVTNNITGVKVSDTIAYSGIEVPKCRFENTVRGQSDGKYNVESTLIVPSGSVVLSLSNPYRSGNATVYIGNQTFTLRPQDQRNVYPSGSEIKIRGECDSQLNLNIRIISSTVCPIDPDKNSI